MENLTASLYPFRFSLLPLLSLRSPFAFPSFKLSFRIP